MSHPKLIAFAGSTRKDSLNKRLARLAAESALAAGAAAEFIDLGDFELPLFNEDFESANGMPDGAKRFKAKLQAADGILIASPEYNSSVTAVLKNAIDWASRSERDDEAPLSAFQGKWAALMSASPGALGGMRGLVHLRSILGNIGVHVVPHQITVSTAHEAFAPNGQLQDPQKAKQLDHFVKNFAEVVGKVAA